MSRSALQQDFVGDGAAERADAAAAQVRERAKLSGVRGPDAEDLAELVIRNGDGVACPAGGRILDAAEADLGVAARDRLVDRGERDLDELRLPAEATGNQLGDVDVESRNSRRIGGIGFDVRRAALGIAGPTK